MRLLRLAMMAAITFAGGQAADAPAMLFEGEASLVGEFTLDLGANEIVEVETSALSRGSDPVLHLFDRTGRQIAMDDNAAGGKAARLHYRTTAKDTYRVVVRARSSSTAGTADLLKNGSIWQRHVTFAGWPVELEGLRAGETIESVRLPNGAGPTHALYLLASDGVAIEQRVVGGGVAGAARFAVTRDLGSRVFVFGVPHGRIPISSQGPVRGRTRVVRNDAGIPRHDFDGDGLGNELEHALGTCSSLSDWAPGVTCRDLADSRDTDGDGISDQLEAIGKLSPAQIQNRSGQVLSTGGLPLPLWGANPRHKDLFVEVDFMRRTKQENDANVGLKMPASVARRFAEIYGDSDTISPSLRAVHASDLGNPDGQPGISVHLDIGRPPERASDAIVFGDWGGYTAVDAVESGGEYIGASANQTWKTSMSPTRRGVFRYALAYGTGGGQTGTGFAASYNFNDAFNSAHETGHSLGLQHQGVPNDPSADVNCKPNYPSIMNYAFTSGVGFSDGRAAEGPTLNNWALPESNLAPSTATSFFNTLRNNFGYWVDPKLGRVDWNRDGEFAPPGATVRAYANYLPGGGGGGCEFTRYNQTRIGAESTSPPAVARLANRLYVFYSQGGGLHYSSSTSTWNCPPPAQGCANGTWSAGPSPFGQGTGMDAVRVRAAGREELLVVAVSGLRLYERRLSLQGDAEQWTDWRQIPSSAPFGQPSLALATDGSVYLAYRGRATARYHVNRWTPSGSWTGERPVVDLDGNPLAVRSDSRFAPAIIEAPLDWSSQPEIYGLFAAQDDRLDLWRLVRSTGRWEKTDVLDIRPGPVLYRPALAWVAATPPAARGRLYVLYADAHDGQARMMMSYVRVDETSTPTVKRQKIGLSSPFDNVWALITGVDLIYEEGRDTNLRAVLVHSPARETTPRQLWFRPKADGINFFSYGNANDWAVLRKYICRGLVNPGGVVEQPIRCL